MKKKIILISFLTLIAINVNAQMKLNDFTDAKIYFNGLFNAECSIDEYGNLVLDMGSASSGRHAFRITDVNITMEEKKEEPGCAEVCPPRIIIHFECKKTNCVRDPAHNYEPYQSGSIAIYNLERGKKAFEYLIALQNFMKNN